MNEANKFKLGAFLLIAVTLLIVGFLSAGIMQIFAPKYRAMTVLNTSVEGLAVGSPVKYLGMPVGRITGMAMRESDGFIAVYFEIFPSAVEAGEPDSDGDGYDALNASALMRSKNMMCFINAAGIMGGSYLELSINDSSQPSTPHLDITPPPDVSYIPSRPSHIGNAIQNISRMLDELEKVNFIQLADKLNETLDNMSGLLNQSELRNTLKSINTICNNLENSISRLQTVLSDSNVAKLNRSIDNLDAGIQEFRSSLNGKTLSETMANFDNFEVVSADILKTDIPALVREKFGGLTPIVCANLPYNITTPAITALIETKCFESITVLVQKEVAERLCAAPGTSAYGAFSVFMQYYTEPEYLFAAVADGPGGFRNAAHTWNICAGITGNFATATKE